MKVCIVTDENSGISRKEAKELGIKLLRMPIIIDGETYYEGENLTRDQFYQYLDEDRDVTTSQAAPGEIIELWEETLKEYDQIVHIPMSSGLSESCASAKVLAQDYEGKVFVVDNGRVSVTMKRAVYDAIKLVEKGKNAAEIKEYLENTKADSAIYIMVDTMKYLKKGGRVTAAGAALGSLLKIKPVLGIFGSKLDAYKKSHGVKKAKKDMLNAIHDQLNDRFAGIDVKDLEFALAYTHNPEDAKIWEQEIKDEFGIDYVLADELSLSIATHIGPGALAIAVSTKVK